MRFKYSFLAILLVAIIMPSCLLFQPSFREIWSENSKNQYDAVIVPGIPFEPPTWNDIMKIRVQWGVYLYQKGIAKNIIFTGAAVHTPYRESDIMSLYAEKLGIPKEHIFREPKAEHGSENLYYSVRLADSLGFKNIALATDVYQGSLMFKHIRKFNFDLPYLPIIIDSILFMEQEVPNIDYQSAYIDNFVKLNERVGKVEQYQNSMGRRVKRAIKEEKKAQKRAKKEANSNS